jgi:hypothetical protein
MSTTSASWASADDPRRSWSLVLVAAASPLLSTATRARTGTPGRSSRHHPIRALWGFERRTDLRKPNRVGTGNLGRLHDDQPLQQRVVLVLKRKADHAASGCDEVAPPAGRRWSCPDPAVLPGEPARQNGTRPPVPRPRPKAGRPDPGSSISTHVELAVRLLQNGAQRLQPIRPH